MKAMTATGTRERTQGTPDFCVVAGIGDTTVCTVPDGDVTISVRVVTGVGVRFLFAGMADGIIVVPDVPVGVGRLIEIRKTHTHWSRQLRQYGNHPRLSLLNGI